MDIYIILFLKKCCI